MVFCPRPVMDRRLPHRLGMAGVVVVDVLDFFAPLHVVALLPGDVWLLQLVCAQLALFSPPLGELGLLVGHVRGYRMGRHVDHLDGDRHGDHLDGDRFRIVDRLRYQFPIRCHHQPVLVDFIRDSLEVYKQKISSQLTNIAALLLDVDLNVTQVLTSIVDSHALIQSSLITLDTGVVE